MKTLRIGLFVCTMLVCGVSLVSTQALAQERRNWPQWGQSPQHTGAVDVVGQNLNQQLVDMVYNPFADAEAAETDGELLVHYQVPLLDEQDVFMEFRRGTFIPCIPPGSGTPFPCGVDARNSEIWSEKRLHWEGGQLVEKWVFDSDWKPEPDAGIIGGWTPVFHAVLANGHVYVPGSAGTVFKLNRGNGRVVARINPFGGVMDPNTFVAGPLSADDRGNIYYNAIKLTDPAVSNPWLTNVVGSWLVKIAADDSTSKVSFTTLVPGAPTTCFRQFGNSTLPWPPPPNPDGTPAQPSQGACGTQRPGLNVAPAIAPDGTIYTVSRAHFNSRYSFLVAVNPDLTPKWAASLRDRLNDGCGVLVPIAPDSTPRKGMCRNGATVGVDPQTNQRPAGRVIDQSSSSPTVLPDGSVLYGAYSRYNIARGHLFKFSSSGQFLAAFDFGWDSTPAVFQHDGTFSIVIKDNHYDEEAGFYCNPTGGVSNIVCAFTGVPAGPFFITQLSPNLVPEWKFQSTETKSCTRQPDGSLSCVEDHPHGFEWCINAPAVDQNGVVYANSEDGNAYAINQGGTLRERLFLKLALGAAYTPLSIGRDGKIYTQNDGHLFVAGN